MSNKHAQPRPYRGNPEPDTVVIAEMTHGGVWFALRADNGDGEMTTFTVTDPYYNDARHCWMPGEIRDDGWEIARWYDIPVFSSGDGANVTLQGSPEAQRKEIP